MACGRCYTVTFTAVSVSAQQDFFYIKPAADKPVQIEWAKIRNVGLRTEAGDADEDFWQIALIYLPATVTVGSGGSAPTPAPLEVNDTAASFTARVNDTSKATTSGTAVTLDSDGMNNRIGYDYLPIPENRPVVANAAAIVLALNSTPTGTNTLNGSMYVRELV
jgi:hypothetical protein